LRFDPDEIPPTHQFEIGPITLTANNAAKRGTSYPVTYSLSYRTDTRVDFYYSADPDPHNPRTRAIGAVVASTTSTLGSKRVYLPLVTFGLSEGAPLPAAVSTFHWDLTAVSPGSYYISADVTDKLGNITTWVSEVPLVVTP
jgi:hypothetical protein